MKEVDTNQLLESLAASGWVIERGETHARLNESGNTLCKLQDGIRKLQGQMDASYAGAILAKLFLANPWLASFEIGLNSSMEYDDRGGYFFCCSVTVSDVEALDGVEMPQDLTNSGTINPIVAADYLENILMDHETSLYDAFSGDRDAMEDLSITVCRARVAPMLQNQTLDGREAFAALFPELEWRITGERSGLDSNHAQVVGSSEAVAPAP